MIDFKLSHILFMIAEISNKRKKYIFKSIFKSVDKYKLLRLAKQYVYKDHKSYELLKDFSYFMYTVAYSDISLYRKLCKQYDCIHIQSKDGCIISFIITVTDYNNKYRLSMTFTPEKNTVFPIDLYIENKHTEVKTFTSIIEGDVCNWTGCSNMVQSSINDIKSSIRKHILATLIQFFKEMRV